MPPPRPNYFLLESVPFAHARMPGVVFPNRTHLITPALPSDPSGALAFAGELFSDHLDPLLDSLFQSLTNSSLSSVQRSSHCSQDLGGVHRQPFPASLGILPELPSTPEILPFWNNPATLLLLTQASKLIDLLILPQQ